MRACLCWCFFLSIQTKHHPVGIAIIHNCAATTISPILTRPIVRRRGRRRVRRQPRPPSVRVWKLLKNHDTATRRLPLGRGEPPSRPLPAPRKAAESRFGGHSWDVSGLVLQIVGNEVDTRLPPCRIVKRKSKKYLYRWKRLVLRVITFFCAFLPCGGSGLTFSLYLCTRKI